MPTYFPTMDDSFYSGDDLTFTIWPTYTIDVSDVSSANYRRFYREKDEARNWIWDLGWMIISSPHTYGYCHN